MHATCFLGVTSYTNWTNWLLRKRIDIIFQFLVKYPDIFSHRNIQKMFVCSFFFSNQICLLPQPFHKYYISKHILFFSLSDFSRCSDNVFPRCTTLLAASPQLVMYCTFNKWTQIPLLYALLVSKIMKPLLAIYVLGKSRAWRTPCSHPFYSSVWLANIDLRIRGY